MVIRVYTLGVPEYRVPTRHTLWGCPGTYPVYTLGVHGYLPGIYPGGTRVPPVYTLGVHGYLPGIYSGGSRVTTRYILWGYPGTYPEYNHGVPWYRPGIYSGGTRIPIRYILWEHPGLSRVHTLPHTRVDTVVHLEYIKTPSKKIYMWTPTGCSRRKM